MINITNIITPEDYKQYQPSIESTGINDTQLQDCINAATDALSAITKHLIIDVYVYNNPVIPQADIDTNNPLYRNDNEMEELYRAVLSQTHYVINSGNDNSMGDASFSGAGISASTSIPDRTYINDTTYQHLVNARLIQSDLGNKTKCNNTLDFGPANDFTCGNDLSGLIKTFNNTYVFKKWDNYVPNKLLGVNDAGLVVETSADFGDIDNLEKQVEKLNKTQVELSDTVNVDLKDFNGKIASMEYVDSLPAGKEIESAKGSIVIDTEDNVVDLSINQDFVKSLTANQISAGENVNIAVDPDTAGITISAIPTAPDYPNITTPDERVSITGSGTKNVSIDTTGITGGSSIGGIPYFEPILQTSGYEPLVAGNNIYNLTNWFQFIFNVAHFQNGINFNSGMINYTTITWINNRTVKVSIEYFIDCATSINRGNSGEIENEIIIKDISSNDNKFKISNIEMYDNGVDFKARQNTFYYSSIEKIWSTESHKCHNTLYIYNQDGLANYTDNLELTQYAEFTLSIPEDYEV